ncbi:MAG TPA: globin family protein [Reyranella sp.]|jgi:hemoglobin-like flavoprotein|nr:globin family protein [Reyranella sp.]
MTPKQVALVQASFIKVAPIAGAAADLFYDRLFETAPDVRRMFPNDLAEQKKKLMTMLGTAVAGLSKLEALLPVVRALGARHAGYGVAAEHFAPVGAALIWTLEQGLGDGFTPDVKAAWVEVYGVLSRTMIDGMEPLPKAA